MIREGLAFVDAAPVMGPGMWAATAVNFVCGAQLALYPLYLVRDLHAAPGLVGVLLAADGLGTPDRRGADHPVHQTRSAPPGA